MKDDNSKAQEIANYCNQNNISKEQLQSISGGGACSFVSDVGDKINPYDCPKCGANGPKKDGDKRVCKKCGHVWYVDDSYLPH